jgi:hypothetical protein
MSKAEVCCRDLASLGNGPSPFDQIIALGFYDGPTSGVLRCGTCGAAYRFDMLDWSEDHDVRIIRLAALPPQAWKQCVDALIRTESPHWPVWVPWVKTRPSEEAREAADRALGEALALAKPADLVLAWSGNGERILAARRLPANDLARAPDWFSSENGAESPDWFAILGLADRKGSHGGPLSSPAGS